MCECTRNCVQINQFAAVFVEVMAVKVKEVVKNAHTSRREQPLPNQQMGMGLHLEMKTVMTGAFIYALNLPLNPIAQVQ